MPLSSHQRRYTLRNQAIDELIVDRDAFRESVSVACGDFSRKHRKLVEQIHTATPTGFNLLDQLHDTLLPTLRRMTTRANSKQLRETISDSFLLESDQVALIASDLLEKRINSLINDFLNESTAALPKKQAMTVREHAQHLIGGKSAAELADLYTDYLTYEVYTSVARDCLVSFVDPRTNRRARKAAAKRILREQATYSETLRQHRQNASYRIEQISRVYDRLPDAITANEWNMKKLLAMRKSYDAATEQQAGPIAKQPERVEAFLAATADFVSTEVAKHIPGDKQTLQSAIDARQETDHHLAHLFDLSPIQLEYLPAWVNEFQSLLRSQQRLQKRR